MQTIESTITSVTVYNDRAQITRTSICQLEQGEHVLIFDELPSAIDTSSIQVNGHGDAILYDVSPKTVHYEEIKQDELRKLTERKEECQEEINNITDRLTEIELERGFVNRIVSMMTEQNEETNSSREICIDPGKWEPMVNYYRKKHEALNKEKAEYKIAKEKLTKEIASIDNKRFTYNQNQYRSGLQVTVKLEMTQPGKLILDLNYIIKGPSWRPYYDVRVDSEEKTVKLYFKASVKQNTTEDWINCKINLSTATPQISAEEKQLTPMYVEFKRIQEEPISEFADFSDDDLKKMHKEKLTTGMLSAKGGSEGLSEINAERKRRREIKRSKAVVEQNTLSALFTVNGEYDVLSNNEAHEVSILMHEFSANFYHSVIPKLSRNAYLKADVVNDTEYPFLRGPSNIFLDNAFVAKSQIEQVNSGDKFQVSLGVDPGIQVDYMVVDKISKDEGLLNKKNKVHYKYKIFVTNKKNKEQTIVMQDQLPISNISDIKVELLEPKIKDGAYGFKKKEHEVLKWTFNLKPSEKFETILHYSIEYPKNEEVVFATR